MLRLELWMGNFKEKFIRTTRHRLNRYLGNICDADLTQDAEFKESEKVFFSVYTDLKRECFGGVDHHPPVDDSDLKKMYQHFDLKNPNSLQRRVFCDIMLYLADEAGKISENLKLLI